MTENKRIALNVFATYGRSLIALVIGLFTSRWVLAALGQEDFGLYGMVGGMIFFVSFINFIFTGSISRFYAIGQGELRKKKGNCNALEECRQWFSVAAVLMTAVPTILTLIGYPVGAWAVRNWLNIPPSRVDQCIWVLRFAFTSMWIGFANVPFSAMYTAKQRIAELTVYSLLQSLFTFIFVWYMASHPGIWLAKYAMGTCLIAIVPQVIICVRALWAFPECRMRFSHMLDAQKYGKLVSFAGWCLFGNLGWLLKVHGVAILVNKYFGPRVNASLTISNQVTNHSNSLSASLQGAFSPAIVTAYGAGEKERFNQLVNVVSRLKAILFAIFMLPLLVELDEVLLLWLKNPPPGTALLCCVALLSMLFDNCTSGFYIAICASGEIARYQVVSGTSLIMSLPLAWLMAALGGGLPSIAVALFVCQMGASLSAVFFARKLLDVKVVHWFMHIFFPISCVCAVSGIAAYSLRFLMHDGIVRLMLSTIVTEVLLLSLSWFLIMGKEERDFLVSKLGFIGRFLHRN